MKKQIIGIILLAIFALATTACSRGTKMTETSTSSETKPAENKSDANKSSSGLSSSSSSRSTDGDLAGTYTVKGAGADGNSYNGEVVITRRDEVYQLSWTIGAEKYDGVAIREGDTIAAAYTTGDDGKGCGAVIYKINADNSLDGKWGEWGVNSGGTEKAVPIGETKDGSIGAFAVSGTNPNGTAYKGKLIIGKGGNDVYQFVWETGTRFVGTGVKLGDYLAAGSGPKQCGFVIYEVSGDTLEGKWGVPGSNRLGTEKAVKK